MSRRPPYYEQGRNARHRELIAVFTADEIAERRSRALMEARVRAMADFALAVRRAMRAWGAASRAWRAP